MQRLNINITSSASRGAGNASAAALQEQFDASMSEVLGNLRNVINAIDGATPELVREALEPTFEKSQQIVPVKNGHLKESGYLEARKVAGGAEAEMGYGLNGTPDYAIYVHEMPYGHRPPYSDKFLERPVNEDYPQFAERLALLIREATGA